jgi:membrane protein implicated in regulation of membrane protease activity
MSVLFWVVMAVALGVVEIVSVTLFPIFFSISALVALVFYLADLPDWSQWLVFVVGGLLLSVTLRPIAKRQLDRGPTLKQGFDTLVGRHGVLTVAVDSRSNSGTILIDGQSWSARSVSDTAAIIPAGTDVEIREVRGATLIVAPPTSTGVPTT